MRPNRVERRLHRRLRGCQARDVELDDEQVVGLADGIGHGFVVAAGGDDCVAGGECGPHDVDAHTSAAPVMNQTLLSVMYFSPFSSACPWGARGTTEARPGAD